MEEVVKVEHLDIPERAKRALIADGVTTVEQICSMSVAEIDRTPDLGKVAQKYLMRAVLAAGYPGPAVYRKGERVKPRVRVLMGRA